MDYRDDSGGLLLRAAALEEEIEGLRASVQGRKQELAEAKSTPAATPTATPPEERLAAAMQLLGVDFAKLSDVAGHA